MDQACKNKPKQGWQHVCRGRGQIGCTDFLSYQRRASLPVQDVHLRRLSENREIWLDLTHVRDSVWFRLSFTIRISFRVKVLYSSSVIFNGTQKHVLYKRETYFFRGKNVGCDERHSSSFNVCMRNSKVQPEDASLA